MRPSAQGPAQELERSRKSPTKGSSIKVPAETTLRAGLRLREVHGNRVAPLAGRVD